MGLKDYKKQAQSMLEDFIEGRIDNHDAITFINKVIGKKENQAPLWFRQHAKYVLRFEETGAKEQYRNRILHILTSWS